MEAIDRVRADAGDDVAQVCLGLDAVELRATDDQFSQLRTKEQLAGLENHARTAYNGDYFGGGTKRKRSKSF